MSDQATAAPESPAAQSERITPQAAFGSMAGILTSESERFLQAVLSSAKSLDPKNVHDDFLIRFAQQADNFTVGCCDRFAAFLKEASIHAEVRSTSESVLSRLVRNRCFESMDMALTDFLDLSRRASVDISGTVRQLGDSRVRDSLSLGTGLEEDQRRLLSPQAARAVALLKTLEYLGSFQSMGHEFLDYGASKLFGGDVDFVMQQRFQQTIADSIHGSLGMVVGIVEGLDLVKQRKWDQQRAAESATISAVATMASQTQGKRKSGFSSILIAVGCAAPIWLLFQLGIMNKYIIGAVVTLGLAAVFFLFRAIFHLTKS